MSYFVSPEFLRVLVLGFITSLHMTWRRLVNQLVPVPYLDEFFHVPQVQAYWSGKWSHWDPKITTPPGLYIFSYGLNSFRDLFYLDFKPSLNEWRFTNVLLLYMLLVALYILTAVEKKTVNHAGILQREFSIVMFPLIFFFSALYYTDLFSVFTVVLTHIFWSARSSADGGRKVLYQALHLVAGLVSLATRQTNIFWVAVYLGGLQVVESVKHQIGPDKVHDPPVSEASFEDYATTSISLAQAGIAMIPPLLLDLWPQVSLLAAFTAFVIWNGGVVLGDKDNHIATMHLPQMLYIWPLIIFFSWPVMLPQLSYIPALRTRPPRLSTSLTLLALMLVTVNLNTVIHPFTLADNRHYTFYIFRILRQHWFLKYAAVPVYYICACLVIGALGGATREPRPVPPQKSQIRLLYGHDTVRVSWILVWLAATSLSLVTAPLVEPRYFLLPWLTWRLAVPESTPVPVQQSTAPARQIKDSSHGAPASRFTCSLQAVLRLAASYSTALELVWYLLVNMVTCYVFLYKGFEWPQEPGNTQRFMW
ncbi:hypothetical protein A1O3_07285 [Capronia epimyces CBS 606.96]|uniref:Dol-P-Glc:Glc(2)Man(9)GlcNAc(2)-PP-Dol alpha-1,2-glucosyltransferase n=1 Tax=Capronia epimyces CBS 606.96 TaxID=1182542 RepID=W9XKF5_9EURO|nr:uncharacterized protein A1O3_07285 [Capronia epimyces CBS 606.96]EXJ80997.1 hypothetical protein A1O3_07285 [Capronia epimyces CBS 606.96]